MLVNIDLMVRIFVPIDATEEQMITAAVDKAQSLSHDRSWFGEGLGEFVDDEECPYEPDYTPFGYQVQANNYTKAIPDNFLPFECFENKEDAEKWVNAVGSGYWKVVPVYQGMGVSLVHITPDSILTRIMR